MSKKAGVLVVCWFAIGVGFWGCVSSEQRANSNEQVSDNNMQAQGYDAWEEGQRVEVFPQLGHTTGVLSVAFSSDGKYALSGGSFNGIIKLWDITTGREIRIYEGHTNGVTSIAINHDGTSFLSGSYDGTIKLWDMLTGSEIRTFSGYDVNVNCVRISPDGKYAISGGSLGTIKLWDIASGEIIIPLRHSEHILSVAFSPDGRYALSGSSDGTIKLWDIEHILEMCYIDIRYAWDTSKEIYTFEGHKGRINSIIISHDGKYVFSGSNDGTLIQWDITTGQSIRTFEGHTKYVASVAISSDGKFVFGSGDESIKLWDIATGCLINTFGEHTGGAIAISPDGKSILSVSEHSLKLWDIATGCFIRSFEWYTEWVSSIIISPNGEYVTSSSWEKTLKLWDITTGQLIKTFGEHRENVFSIAFSPDGKYVFSSFYNEIKQWDITTGHEIRTIAGHNRTIRNVTISPDGKYALTSSHELVNATLWDISSGCEIITFYWQFYGPRDIPQQIAFSHDGKTVFSTYYNEIKQWETFTGLEIKTFSGHTNSIYAIAISPDGKYMLSSAGDGIRQWDIATGTEIRIFEKDHTSYITSVIINHDGKYALSSSGDKTIKLWDTETGQEIRTFSGHTHSVNSVTFTPDGNRILSGSADGTIRLWDIATGKEIASFISFTDGEWIVIAPDGYYNSSPKGDQYLNVRIENNVYGMDQFAKTFYRPDVVERRLQGLPDPEGFRPEVRIQTASVPPDLRVTAGEVDPDTRQVVLSITATDDIRRISDVQIIVNGRLVGGEELMNVSSTNIEARNTRLVASSEDRQYVFTVILQLDPGLNRIEIVAANDLNYGLGLLTIGIQQTDAPPKGDLWLLAIGVNDYADNPLYQDLKNAVSDADNIIEAFEAQAGNRILRYDVNDTRNIIKALDVQAGGGRRFDNVHTLKIINDEATKQNILGNINDFFEQAGRNDVVALYVSAHGKTENGVYYFFPSDTVFNEQGEFDTDSVISRTELTDALDIPGRKIIMLDTCESGGVDSNQLVHTLRNRSTVIFTASQKDEDAFEAGRFYDGGFFTIGMTEGLKGEAAENGVVMISTLEEYVVDRVSQMSRNRQRPATFVPDGYYKEEFVISVVE